MMNQVEILDLLSKAISQYPEAYEVLGESQRITAYQRGVYDKWLFMIEHNVPILMTLAEANKIKKSVEDLRACKSKMDDYLANEGSAVREDVRCVFKFYNNHLSDLIDSGDRLINNVLDIAFISKI